MYIYTVGHELHDWMTHGIYIYVTKVYYSCKAWSFILTRDSSRWSSRNICLPRKELLTIFLEWNVFNFIIFSVWTKWHLALIVRDSHLKQFSKKSLLVQTLILRKTAVKKNIKEKILQRNVQAKRTLKKGLKAITSDTSGDTVSDNNHLKLFVAKSDIFHWDTDQRRGSMTF